MFILGEGGRKGYSSILSSTSALERVGGQRHVATGIPPGITWYPLYRRLGELQNVSARLRISPPAIGIRSPDHPARSKRLYQLSSPGLITFLICNDLIFIKSFDMKTSVF